MNSEEFKLLMQILGRTVKEGSVDITNVTPFRGNMAEHPVPISRDPWFDQMNVPSEGEMPENVTRLPTSQPSGWPPYEGVGTPGNEIQSQGPEVQPLDPEQFDLLDWLKKGSAQEASQGGFVIYAEGPLGQKLRLDGPFADEFSAHRKLRELQTQSQGKLKLSVGPNTDA